MPVALTLSPKRLHFLLQAIDTHVAAEEAMAIHALRKGWAQYLPMGEIAPYYPEGFADRWRCRHIG